MAPVSKKKKKKEIEIGDYVRKLFPLKERNDVEKSMILQDNPGDPTLECVEVHPDELTPLVKGSDGMKNFKTKGQSSNITP